MGGTSGRRRFQSVYNIVLQLLTVRIRKAYTTQLRFVVYVKYTTQLRFVVYFCVSNSKQLKNIIIFFAVRRVITYNMTVLTPLSHQVKLPVLKFYKVDEHGKVTRLRRECPADSCGAGIFMACHPDRQYCGKCGLTYVCQKPT